jgi:hypothetical protein
VFISLLSPRASDDTRPTDREARVGRRGIPEGRTCGATYAKQGVVGLAIAWLMLAAISLTLALRSPKAARHTPRDISSRIPLDRSSSRSAKGRPAGGRSGPSRDPRDRRWGLRTGVESIGASGYDRFNAGHEIEFLTGIHSGARILGPVALMAIPIGLVALILVVTARIVRRPSATRAD